MRPYDDTAVLDVLDQREEVPARDLIVMHLYEAARIAAEIKEHIDHALFRHIIGMAVVTARESAEAEAHVVRLNS